MGLLPPASLQPFSGSEEPLPEGEWSGPLFPEGYWSGQQCSKILGLTLSWTKQYNVQFFIF